MHKQKLPPKGAIVKIGNRRSISPKAHGLVLKVDRISQEFNEVHGEILANPNGWEHNVVHHVFDPNDDAIIQTLDNSSLSVILKEE